jgi:glucose/arabinose dehydrogenase
MYVLYRQRPNVRGANHFGVRLVFARDGTLFDTQSERFDYRDAEQDLASGLGQILRIHWTGTAQEVRANFWNV